MHNMHKGLSDFYLPVRYQQVFCDVLPCELEDEVPSPPKPVRYEKYAAVVKTRRA